MMMNLLWLGINSAVQNSSITLRTQKTANRHNENVEVKNNQIVLPGTK